MSPAESWNYLCEQHQLGLYKEETQIQSDWENYFAESELFCYSKIKKDIRPQPSIVVGSTERVIPDILLCRNDTKLFIAELKRYNLPKNEKFEKQLLSYLTNPDIHLSIGILICESIYVYCYDFSTNKHLSLEIPFEQNNSNGIRFIELFNKQNFDQKEIQDFVIKRNLARQNISKIKESITENLVQKLLKEHFTKNYSEDDFQKAIEDFEIVIRTKKQKIGFAEAALAHDCPKAPIAKAIPIANTNNDLSKDEIRRICNEHGITLGTYFTKSKLNRGAPKYWANPYVSYLSYDWSLVLLNDKERKLYVFKIPAYSIKENQIKTRKDDKTKIDLQIYSDLSSYPDFEDSRSGIKFKLWIVKAISY